jgi:hypothetical protein
MTTEQHPREWWIRPWADGSFSVREKEPDLEFAQSVHVVEYSALEAMRRERDELREELDNKRGAMMLEIHRLSKERDALKNQLDHAHATEGQLKERIETVVEEGWKLRAELALQLKVERAIVNDRNTREEFLIKERDKLRAALEQRGRDE